MLSLLEKENYEVIENENVSNTELKDAFINETLFSFVTFKNVHFKNVEFFSARFENCEFINCTFIDCTFKVSTMSYVGFTKSEFFLTTWDLSSVRASAFNDCKIDEKTERIILKEGGFSVHPLKNLFSLAVKEIFKKAA